LETLAKYNFCITYKKGIENARADALSRRSDFISKTDRKEALLKEGEDGLEYSREIATVFKVIKNPLLKQRIKDAYLRDARAQRAFAILHKDSFFLNKNGLIRFRRMVYLLEKIRKEFTKELYKELTTRHLKNEKTRDVVVACYYFPFIIKMVERVVKKCDIYQKAKTVRKALYSLLKLPNTLKEL
jgi:hypothetical protein